MKIKEVKPNVFFGDAAGSGSNVMYLKTSEGIVLIDTTSTVEGIQQVLDLAGITRDDVVMLINTHADGDHVGGNSLFACPQYAHQKTYQRMASAERPEDEMPSKTFDAPQMTLNVGEISIELIFKGGHKPGQTIVWLPEQKVLLASDLIFEGCHPFMVGSIVEDWIGALKSLHDFEAEVILPGHGTICSYDEVDVQIDYLENGVALARKHLEKGYSVEDAINDPEFPRPEGWEKEDRVELNIQEFFQQAK